MKYYYLIYNDNIGVGFSNEVPANGTELTKKQFDEVSSVNWNNPIWKDKCGNLHLRNRLTKYDETTDKWIVDQDAIDKDKKQQLINFATNLYSSAYKYTNPYEWNKLTTGQQQELSTYLDTLNDIIDGKDTTSTELPSKPDFIK